MDHGVLDRVAKFPDVSGPRMLPPNDFVDTADQRSRQNVVLGLALVGQGRLAEARAAVAPALEHYRAELKDGATGTDFLSDYAEALYASAMAQEPDAAGRRLSAQALTDASAQLAALSPEARQFVDARELAARIAAAK